MRSDGNGNVQVVNKIGKNPGCAAGTLNALNSAENVLNSPAKCIFDLDFEFSCRF